MSEHENALRLQTPLGRVRGLGSARSGTHHWWMQRVTSIALLPLTLWFVFAVWSLAGSTHEETLAFIARPLNAVLLLSLIAATFHHMAAGLQVVIEDYLRDDRLRLAALLGVKATCWVLALLAALSVLRIAV
jgi:succinate dehydrogenase / fumarate reductase, membrane anchor subunit